MEILKAVDSNSGNLIGDMTLQANVSNLIIVSPKDIYGNVLTEMDTLIFTAELTNADFIFTSKIYNFHDHLDTSKFNHVLKRYEIFVIPRIATDSAILSIKCFNKDI